LAVRFVFRGGPDFTQFYKQFYRGQVIHAFSQRANSLLHSTTAEKFGKKKSENVVQSTKEQSSSKTAELVQLAEGQGEEAEGAAPCVIQSRWHFSAGLQQADLLCSRF